MEQGVRVNKFLSEAGYCSRREADKLIEQGRVTINGQIPEMVTKVLPTDEVSVNGKLINEKKTSDKIYLLFNKPIGIECTTNQSVKGNIVDYINYQESKFHERIFDNDSERLINMTNYVDIINKFLHASNNHE